MVYLLKGRNLQTDIAVKLVEVDMVALVAVQAIHQKNMLMAEATAVQTVLTAAVTMLSVLDKELLQERLESQMVSCSLVAVAPGMRWEQIVR
nr:MAG TPA: hypothetical protein [Caudoviricetes sp.]